MLHPSSLNDRAEDYAGADDSYRAAAGGSAPAAAAPGALRLLRDSNGKARATMPTLATPGDVREAVQYLKKKPGGVSVVEALNDSKRRVFEPRKVAAYESWGLIERRGSRIVLSAFGWEFARKLAPEADAYRDLLGADPVYRAALEWIHWQKADLVTHADLASYLSGQLGGLGEAAGVKTLEGGIVCFFHLCQAAELGTATIGKRGQPARLRVEREELSAWVGRGRRPRAAPWRPSFKPPSAASGEAPRGEAQMPEADPLTAQEPRAASSKISEGPARPLRLYVSASAPGSNLLAEIRDTLELVDVESRVCGRGGQGARAVPVADAAAEAMRGCDAGLLVITKEDCEEGGRALKRSVLIEVGAAYVLYSGSVVLLLEEELELPSYLGDLPRFAFSGDALTWEVGLELLRAIKGFGPAPRRAAP